MARQIHPKTAPRIVSYLHAIAIGLSATFISFDSVAAAALPCLSAPPVSTSGGNVVSVRNDAELQSALSNLADNTTISLQPGDYNLSSTIYVKNAGVTIEGPAGSCDKVNLIGKGMEVSNYGNVSHGIWSDAPGLTVRNLTIRNVYLHAIALNRGAEAPHIYNVRMLDAGQQFIKASSASDGNFVDDGVVEYSIMQYTSGPPATDHEGGGTGYTNGVDVHGGQRWIIRHNVFKDFHTPDSAVNLWNPAILMWRGAKDTVADSNIFINCDRAIAFGLDGSRTTYDHVGGVIKNNMIYYAPNLFSSSRKTESDGAIIVWDSPGTKVYHNSALINGNLNKLIEFRYRTDGAEAKNNLGDGPISGRNSAVFTASNNSSASVTSLFVDPANGNLRLISTAEVAKVPYLSTASVDVDGEQRPTTSVFVGADERLSQSPPMPPTDVKSTPL